MTDNAKDRDGGGKRRIEGGKTTRGGSGSRSDAGGDTVATVEVVYALPDEQALIEVPHRPGLTAAEAVEASRIVERYPALAEQALVLGVHGVEVPHSRALEPGDRVEICRPLVADPRRMRIEKVAQGRTMARRGSDER